MTETQHIPVMLEETMLALEPRSPGVYVDGTLGGGSHTEALLQRSAPEGIVYSFDIYPEAIRSASLRLQSYGSRFQPIEANFADWGTVLRERGVFAVSGMMLDLGFSSDELDDPLIGLSFQQDGVLDMRLGPLANSDGLMAADIINTWSARDLTELFRTYADERYAQRIAFAIVDSRRVAPIVTTRALADLIVASVPASYERGRIHPATRVFLALRMEVNQELPHIRQAIDEAYEILEPGGRLAIITFQSIEDGLVKRAFQDPRWEVITRKPLIPSESELQLNPRSRSAKLRVAQKPR